MAHHYGAKPRFSWRRATGRVHPCWRYSAGAGACFLALGMLGLRSPTLCNTGYRAPVRWNAPATVRVAMSRLGSAKQADRAILQIVVAGHDLQLAVGDKLCKQW